MTPLEAENKLNELVAEIGKIGDMEGLTHQLAGMKRIAETIRGIWGEGYRKGRIDESIIRKIPSANTPIIPSDNPLILIGCDGKLLSTGILVHKLRVCEENEEYESARIIKHELDRRKPND